MSYRKLKRIRINPYTRYIIKKRGVNFLVDLYVKLVYFFKDKDIKKNGER